ncbi:MAG: hypothetical protein ACRCZF_08030 [Gemmataceae bacterium]
MLFAQAPFGDDELLMVILAGFVVWFVLYFTVKVLFLLTLSRALQRCHPRNRMMEPGQVWLNLIPCFDFVWMFITVNRIADTLDEEFYDLRLDRYSDDYGRNLGTWCMICHICGMIPYIGGLFSLASFVLFVLYWVKISGYSKELAAAGGDDFRDDPD